MDIFTASVLFQLEERMTIIEWEQLKMDFEDFLSANNPKAAAMLIEHEAKRFNVIG